MNHFIGPQFCLILSQIPSFLSRSLYLSLFLIRPFSLSLLSLFSFIENAIQDATAEKLEFLAGNTDRIFELLENQSYDSLKILNRGMASAFENIDVVFSELDSMDLDETDDNGNNKVSPTEVRHAFLVKNFFQKKNDQVAFMISYIIFVWVFRLRFYCPAVYYQLLTA